VTKEKKWAVERERKKKVKEIRKRKKMRKQFKLWVVM
jgi:hypothetical protein